jgi:hypothetical protein
MNQRGCEINAAGRKFAGSNTFGSNYSGRNSALAEEVEAAKAKHLQAV